MKTLFLLSLLPVAAYLIWLIRTGLRRQWKKLFIRILLGIFLVFGALLAFCVLPTNDLDNIDPLMRPEMISATLDWGRLAPFPSTARDFDIYTEGGSFTRTFRGSFTDAPDNVDQWIKASLGMTEGKAGWQSNGSVIYDLKMGGGAAFGTVTVSADGSQVSFSVSWS